MNNEFQGTISGAGYGYVYVMSYPGSDKVKIGHSLNPTTRAADIGGTLAPETPMVEAYFWCSERREAVERMAHQIEAANRGNGEWFSISIGRAVEVIKLAAGQVGVSAQLVFDRNEWEIKQNLEQWRKFIADIPRMTDFAFNELLAKEGTQWHPNNAELAKALVSALAAEPARRAAEKAERVKQAEKAEQERAEQAAESERQSREAWASWVKNIPSMTDKDIDEHLKGRHWSHGRSMRLHTPEHVKPALLAEQEARRANAEAAAKLKTEQNTIRNNWLFGAACVFAIFLLNGGASSLMH